MESKYFRLFANNIPVKGFKRSIICDLHSHRYYFITNELYDILNILSKKSIDETLNLIGEGSDNILKQKLDELISKDLGHYINNSDNFPKINESFKSPFLIHDSIIELSKFNVDNIENIFISLSQLGCQTLELRAYDVFPIKLLEIILDKVNLTRIRNVEIYLHENNDTTIEYLKYLVGKYQVIGLILVHSCVNNDKSYKNLNISFTPKRINSEKCCGFIKKENFNLNLNFYIESRAKNTCLNRKISINQYGEIKNCPSIPLSFGNIKNVNLTEVVNNHEFTKLWSINKDQIKTCNVCEFRYICSDCRAFLVDYNDIYSKPLKCGYDPINAIWSDWIDNPLNRTSILKYDL